MAESETTAGERRILADAPSGNLVDLTDLSDEECVVSPDVIRRLCIGPEANEVDPRGIRIKGARIVEPLDLSYCTIPHPLRFEATTFEATPDLSGAQLPAVLIVDCSLPGLRADGIRVGDLRLGSSKVTGEVRLQDARMSGTLDCSGATVANESGNALFADGAEIRGSVFLGGRFSATGGVRFPDARIGGQLVCSSATLTNKGGEAFSAEAAEITGHALFQNGFCATGAMGFNSARIGGQLDCSGATLSNAGGTALSLDQAEITGLVLLPGLSATGEVWLLGARIGGMLDCSGARLSNEGGDALSLDGAEIAGGVVLPGLSATGAVRLLGARIGGNLYCSDATLSNEDGIALVADGAEIGGSVLLSDGFSATGRGGVRLTGASIGRELNCSGATLASAGGEALALDRAKISGGVFLQNGFRATGQVGLLGARIGDQLNCSGAKLSNEDGTALVADGAEISGTVFLQNGFSATGEVRLLNAKIGGQLACPGAMLRNEGGDALSADEAEISGGVFLQNGFSATGAVRFNRARIRALICAGATLTKKGGDALAARDATIGSALVFSNVRVIGGVDLFRASATTLDDDLGRASDPLGSWGGVQPLVLDSFAYARFSPEAVSGSKHRCRWLQQTSKFEQSAWQQLIEIYRAQGRDDEATRAAIAMHNDRIRRAGLPWYRRWGRQILRVVIGHGYRPLLAGVWAAGIIAAFALVVWQWSGMFVPETPGPQPVAYAIDTFLPIIDLGQAGDWTPTGWVRWVAWGVILSGWALTTLFVAGFTRIVRS